MTESGKQKPAEHSPGATAAIDSGASEKAPIAAPESAVFGDFAGIQYEQLHELKRMYNGMIFQAPAILFTLLTVAATFGDKLFTAQGESNFLRDNLPYFGLSFGAFSLILSHWAYRSRWMLKVIEETLERFDETYGSLPIHIYPPQIARRGVKKRSDRKFAKLVAWPLRFASMFRHSTILMIVFMYTLSFIIIGLSGWALIRTHLLP